MPLSSEVGSSPKLRSVRSAPGATAPMSKPSGAVRPLELAITRAPLASLPSEAPFGWTSCVTV
ncbi:hypothetical protein D3C72_1293160 [compost metagenome]